MMLSRDVATPYFAVKRLVQAFLLSSVLLHNQTLAATDDSDCAIVLSADDAMRFSSTEILAKKSCPIISLTLHHTGRLPRASMGHNWVLTKEADFRGVVSDGVMAGPANSYILEGDSRVVAVTKLIGGGESTTVSFPTEKMETSERYIFFCSYPGHWGIMKGTFLLT